MTGKEAAEHYIQLCEIDDKAAVAFAMTFEDEATEEFFDEYLTALEDYYCI